MVDEGVVSCILYIKITSGAMNNNQRTVIDKRDSKRREWSRPRADDDNMAVEACTSTHSCVTVSRHDENTFKCK